MRQFFIQATYSVIQAYEMARNELKKAESDFQAWSQELIEKSSEAMETDSEALKFSEAIFAEFETHLANVEKDVSASMSEISRVYEELRTRLSEK